MGKFGYGGPTRLISNGRSYTTKIPNAYINNQPALWRSAFRISILSFGGICYAR
jgi:hypothetical protein